MSFLGHLEELRWHLVRSFAAIFIFSIVLFVFQKQVYDYFLLAHLKPDFITYTWFCNAFGAIGIESSFCTVDFPQKLQSLSLTNQLMNSLWTSAILGLILAFPTSCMKFGNLSVLGYTRLNERAQEDLFS